jgi:hypothetical protein
MLTVCCMCINSREEVMPMPKVYCDVKGCKYNDDGKCIALEIKMEKLFVDNGIIASCYDYET